ncbi:hypothetical protein [Streptomyces sp. RLB3-6]|uniref:hypothetical protein n=1 Tax=Streptomyces sp. RLB3-6 TaxID=2594457 RepID=UPI001164FABC|nr:hypothetical protein [Streptomyces sp. RLB3-6]QDN84426.1 hypothetical protein FNV61_00455 [Streptomyces sp. RLB3-6]
MSVSYTRGKDARKGGLDITLSLTPAQAEALGPDADDLGDWIDTALWALALLRSGQGTDGPHTAGPNDWSITIGDLDVLLLPRLEALRDAAVRAHAQLGGTYGQLAAAMNTTRSTAQYRRDALLAKEPTELEQWAAGISPTR